MKGFKNIAGVTYVWDLAADGYVPVKTPGSGSGPSQPTEAGLGKVEEGLGKLDPSRLDRAEREDLYGERDRPRRHPRAGG